MGWGNLVWWALGAIAALTVAVMHVWAS